MSTEPHIFYTCLDADGKPAPGARAIPLRLIRAVSVPGKGGWGETLRFLVQDYQSAWLCWGASDEATASMHWDLMECWGALHKPEPEPEQATSMDPGQVVVETLDRLCAERDQLKAERDLAREHERQAVANLMKSGEGRDQLKAERDRLRREVSECHKEISQFGLIRQERDRLANFRTFVHARLDRMGAPADPEAAGSLNYVECHVGDRLDWVEKHVDLATAAPDAQRIKDERDQGRLPYHSSASPCSA
jgi:hypothetical protein